MQHFLLVFISLSLFQIILLSFLQATKMPYTPLSHSQMRLKVCAVCYCRSGLKASKTVTPVKEKLIQQFVYSDYNKEDERFPCGLCLTCYFSLNDQTKGYQTNRQDKVGEPRKVMILDSDSYEAELKRVTRSSSGLCECRICEVGRLNGGQWMHFVAEMRKTQSSDNSESSNVKYDRLCKDCFAPIYKGNNHTKARCNSKTMTRENVIDAVENSNTSVDLVASDHIKNRAVESGDSFKLRSHLGGPPITITLGKPAVNNQQIITHEQAKIIQVEAKLSDSQIKKISKNLRLQLGRKVIEPKLREALVENKRKFDQYFSADTVQFQGKDGKYVVRPFVFCSNFVGFVQEILQLRDLDISDVVLKIGLDGGKGHLKMILTIFDPNNVLKVDQGGRVTREYGIGSGQDDSLLGRKKIFILAISPQTPENYKNLQLFYDMVGVNKLEYKQTGDFKALNILTGLMSCSSLCGCCFCEARRDSDEWTEGGARLRTLNNIQENLKRFKEEANSDPNKAKFVSANCVNKPIVFDEDDSPDSFILLKCPPPALHLKLSLNHLLKELSKVWPGILVWLEGKHIVYEPYHGGQTLEGNDCNKVLRNLDSLMEILPQEFSAFIDTLLAFKNVVDSCFGYVLDPFYKQVLEKFRSSLKKLSAVFNVSITNKLYVICVHLEEFFDLVGNGLAMFTEQETENSHSDFDSLFDRYRVKDVQSKVYGLQYFKAVMNYNTNNV